MKKHSYQYLAIGGKEAAHFGGDKVREKVEDLKTSTLFEFIREHKKAVLIFKIV
ncbi:MAG: hypothetical protein KAS66_14010 [Candidatus Omnitrophica bacterium]|nr:hypothetical protein [Candidatus Omnitrophota bacterium]